jgi:hypothetical protein
VNDPSPAPDEQAAAVSRARIVLERHHERLLSLPNVVGVGVGLRQKDGQWTSQVALVVMVSRKLPLEALSVQQRIPAEIENVPVDVQETGDMFAPG